MTSSFVTAGFVLMIMLGAMPPWLVLTVAAGVTICVIFRPH